MTAILHDITWEVPATLLGIIVLLAAAARAARGIRARLALKPGHRLRNAIIAIGAALAPVFFADMFTTVVTLLGPSFHGWAWTVPTATEGSFIFVYLLDLYLLMQGKPMGWLRYGPYPFAAASLVLNIYSSLGSIPGMIGHGVVTVAFFLPILAGEAAVKSLSVSDEAVRLADEMKAARRYAIDLVRDQKGFLWRLRPSVPSLLRTRIVSGRLPAIVMTAVRQGAADHDASAWEAAIEKMVTDALTQHDRVAASVRQERKRIDRQDQRTDDRHDGSSDDRHDERPDDRHDEPKARQSPAAAAAAQRARVREILADEAGISLKEITERTGVSVATVTRVKREMKEEAAGHPKAPLTAVQ